MSGEILPPLQDRKILNYGQIVGSVVADSFEQDMVRVLCPFVGGAFGCKGSMWMFSPLTAAAA